MVFLQDRIGFYTALGTPQQPDGSLHTESLRAQVCDQVAHGATGLLVMGSMGLGVFVPAADYPLAAKTAVEAAGGKATVFIGVSDTCVRRCRDRIEALRGLDFDGVVATAPYYYAATAAQQTDFFRALADSSPYPLYLYDLPAVSKSKITYPTALALGAHPNIRGVKTADLTMAVDLLEAQKSGALKADFSVLYSGLDSFDSAAKLGVGLQLDGMFACTGPIAGRMYSALRAGDYAGARECLRQILRLRDVFVTGDVLAGFTHAMHLLGYAGNFAPDYFAPPAGNMQEEIRACMKEIDLL